MPREIVHWSVLDQVADRIKGQDAEIYNLLKKHRAAAYLGAMGPDAPYYHRAGRSEFEHVAEYLHGNEKEDTFDPVRKISKVVVHETDTSSRETCWAFVFGFVSHIITDSIFHPMVYYLTGNYYHSDPVQRSAARVRHRIFEVYLDSWFRSKSTLWNNGKMKQVSKELGEDKLKILSEVLGSSLLSLPNFPLIEKSTKDHEKLWHDSFRHMVFFQDLLISPKIGALVSALNKLLFGGLRETEALVLYSRELAQEVFDALISYRNPVSGDQRNKTVLELLEETVTNTKDIFLKFLPLIYYDTKDVNSVLGEIKGLSLNFGLYKVNSENALYYSNTGFGLPGLQII